MSYQVGSICYPTPVDAARAAVSDKTGQVFVIGGQAYTYRIDAVSQGSGNDAYVSASLRSPAGSVIDSGYSFQPQQCGLLGTDDAVVIGWTIGGIWLSVYAVMFIARTVRKMMESTDDVNA